MLPKISRVWLSICRHDSEDHSGLQYVVKVILHLLDPLIPEFSASYVGKLIIVFIRKVIAISYCLMVTPNLFGTGCKCSGEGTEVASAGCVE